MGPDEHHYEAVIRFLVDQGTVVPLLGSRVCGTLPDAEKIAADLAERFGLESGLELPRVAQQVYVSSGRPDLVRTLRQILAKEGNPHPVHQFLARFPRELERLGLPARYQMIVTTNYDTTLERAFDEENEPYDLAVYMASGDQHGHFVHFPFDRDPEPITVPNRYGKFPIDDFGELTRTVIVKIHGGCRSESGGYGAKDNFVITEDHYIDYLSAGPIESLVPVQILGKLSESHCLFLGYAMRDWHLRVFLKRIWRGEPLGSRSWAIDEIRTRSRRTSGASSGSSASPCASPTTSSELERQPRAERAHGVRARAAAPAGGRTPRVAVRRTQLLHRGRRGRLRRPR